MTIPSHIVAQFRRPQGLLGRVAGSVMANRPSNRQRNLWTVELLEIRPDDQILEIGCGPGLALAACAERLETGRVTGLDHSQTMIAQAAKRNKKAIADGRVELWHGDLSRLAALPGPSTGCCRSMSCSSGKTVPRSSGPCTLSARPGVSLA